MARTPHGDRGGCAGSSGRGGSAGDDQAGSSGDRRRPPRGLARGLLGNPPQAPLICRVGTTSILDATPRNTLLGIVRNRFSSPWMRWADVDDRTRGLIIAEFRVEEDVVQGIVGVVHIPSDDARKEEVISALVSNLEAMISDDRKITALF